MEELSEVLKRLGTRSISADSVGLDQTGPGEEEEPCPRCGGRSWITADVPVGHPAFGQYETCECQQQTLDDERYDRLLRYSNLGLLARFTFETLKADGTSDEPESRKLFSEAYGAAVEFCENPSGWLVFSGPNGSGKTHLAAAIGNSCIDRGLLAFFAHVPDLLDHLRATFGPANDIAYSDLFELVKTTPLLILDGLGSHSATAWAEEKLGQVINHRYNAELPTVVTMSVPMDALDPYLLARLKAPGFSRMVVLRSGPPAVGLTLGTVPSQMLQRMTFDKFDVRGNNPNASQRSSLEAAHMAARSFASDPDGWITLIGDTGVGKTHLAVAIAAEQMEQGRSVFFAFVPELLDHLRYTFSPESTVTYDRLFQEVKNTPMLILDDLGKERSNPWAVEKLYQIIVHRHNARLPTVITSMARFTDEHDPISSRLRDPYVNLPVEIDAPDYRNRERSPKRTRRTSTRRQAGWQ